MEYYLPLFFENELETLFDYIGEDALFVSLGDVHAEANRFWSDVKSRYAMAQGDETYPPLLPQYLYLSADVFAGRLKNYGQVLPDVSGKEHTLPDLAVNRQADEPLQALKDFQTTFDGRILLCAESLGRRETMLGFLQQNGLKAKPVSDWQAFLNDDAPLCITVTSLTHGFQLPLDAAECLPNKPCPALWRAHWCILTKALFPSTKSKSAIGSCRVMKTTPTAKTPTNACFPPSNRQKNSGLFIKL